MKLAYDFVERENEKCGEPPFPIPDIRYVKAALAVAKHVDNEIYLIEELIGEEDGGFEKYINNVYAVPLSTNDLQRKERGDFLAFTQHIQYTKTKKLAFVLDQQGESNLFCFVLMKFLKCPSFRWPQLRPYTGIPGVEIFITVPLPGVTVPEQIRGTHRYPHQAVSRENHG